MTLPFLYRHGQLLSVSLLLLLLVASLLLLTAINRRLGPRRARSLLQSLKARERSIDVGWRIIRGRIVEGWAETTDGFERKRVRRSDRLVLESGGERVVVIGDVRVMLGTSDGTAPSNPAVKRVGEDDEIYVVGTFRRSEDGAWEVAAPPSSLDRFVELTATAPAPTRGRMSTAAFISWALVLAVGWYMGLRIVGKHELDDAKRAKGPFSEVASFDALAIAAAVPASHDEALALLEDRLDREFERTEDALQLQLADVARDCRFYSSGVPELISVGRSVVTARAEIAAALRFQQVATVSGSWVGEIPFQLVHDLMLNREVARAFGDDEQVRRLQAIIDRHLVVLNDPNRALPLLVLDALD